MVRCCFVETASQNRFWPSSSSPISDMVEHDLWLKTALFSLLLLKFCFRIKKNMVFFHLFFFLSSSSLLTRYFPAVSLGQDSPCTFKPPPRIAWWQGETPQNPAQPFLFPVPFTSCEPPGGICNMKFPFGAGKFPVCRFLGNVAGDGVVGETLACVIPACPQPRVRHLHPILPPEFPPIPQCWETATPVWRGNCKIKRLVFI